MYQPGGQPPRQPEMNFDQMMGGARDTVGRIAQRLGGGGVGLAVVLIIALIVIIWAATGIYTISPGEQAALRLFGAAQATPVTETGLHWWWPSPVGRRDVVQTVETRRMELGFRSGEAGAIAPVPVEAQMISGDLNIIDVQMVVQYNIKNLNDFLFRVDDPGENDGAHRDIPVGHPDGRTLKDATEAALRLVVGQSSIVEVLAEDRIELQDSTTQRLQEILDSYHTGINVISVELQKVEAPEDVRAAFNDVLQARQDKVTATNQAQAYENQVIPEARGRAEQIIQPAQAFKQARIQRARGEADQFLSILGQYSDRSIRLTNTLQDTDGSDQDGNPATGIGIEDVSVVDGAGLFVSNLSVQGAPDCGFTAREVESSASATQLCGFSVLVDGASGSPGSGFDFSVAYLGNEDLTVPQFATSGSLNLRLSNLALDLDNADGDNDLKTGVTAADISVVDGPDGGARPGVDLSVSGFNSRTNILTLAVQEGEELEPGASFTVQYLNRETLTIPYTSQVTQERLYLEAMEEILPAVNKILVPEGTEPVLLIGGQEGVVPVPVGPSPSP
ncbi:MAG: FtsH protease activity modulator HflK [Chloroflexi bacterium]|nr:FtsH protease activity modulator HflK [Chloroflexota bacterium]MYE38606.1 FtsH protease activity modulator HflK [Chloroflexota bacterium]